jgi:signal transduction histidine kinase
MATLASAAAVGPRPLAKPRVLCVDDEPLAVEGISNILHKRFEVVTATSGAAGLAVLREQPAFHVVISDFQMPGMNGAAFLRQAQALAPDTIRMLLTGKAGFDDAMQVINEGYIFRFLSKPCPPEVLIQALDAAVEQHRLRIADRELLELKVAEISAQLLHADRLATLGKLATGVGHELSNVIVVFLSLVDAMHRSVEDNRPPTQREIDDLERVGEHLQLHAKHLMHLGRQRPDAVRVVDLATVVRETLDLLKTLGKIKRLSVTFEAPPTQLLVKVSRVQLEQVLVNLLVNAADALEHAKGSACVAVKLWKDGNRVGCSIRDNGSGIAPEHLNAIFEPYFTTKEPGKGTGLGLPVVRQIIEGYGSQLAVESELGRGTTFSFHLDLTSSYEEDQIPDLTAGPSLGDPAAN